MTVTLSGAQLRHIAAFEAVTGATARDCLLGEEGVVFLVAPGEMGAAIGPGGRRVQRLEARLGTDVRLVEAAEEPAAFVANALAPAAVRGVTVSEQGGRRVAYAEVPEADRGVAIGADGRRIEAARELARRHVGIEGIELV